MSSRGGASSSRRYVEEDDEEDEPDHDADDDDDEDNDPDMSSRGGASSSRTAAVTAIYIQQAVDRAHMRNLHNSAVQEIVSSTRKPTSKAAKGAKSASLAAKADAYDVAEAAEIRVAAQLGPGWCAELQIGDGKTGPANLAKRRLSAQTASIRSTLPMNRGVGASGARSNEEAAFANALLTEFTSRSLPLPERTSLSTFMSKVCSLVPVPPTRASACQRAHHTMALGAGATLLVDAS